MRATLVAAAVTVLMLMGTSVTASYAASSCPSFSTHGYRFSKVKGYSMPCNLGRAAVGAWAKSGFRDLGPKTFTWHGGKASFLCYFYGRPSGPGKCKGGVTKDGKTYPYGTIDWQKRTRS